LAEPETVIDLRSDTVTRPSQSMRAAMAGADVGDDVWGDDPTVLRLQAVVAERAGKEASLFFPSGTQSNLAALMAHCDRGDEYLVGQGAHTYRYEGGGAAVLGGIQPQPIANAPDGTLPLQDIAAAIKPIDFHFARTRLLAIENTANGRVLPEDYVREAVALARSRGLSAHLDGARVCAMPRSRLAVRSLTCVHRSTPCRFVSRRGLVLRSVRSWSAAGH
jgi:threonine aldolase